MLVANLFIGIIHSVAQHFTLRPRSRGASVRPPPKKTKSLLYLHLARKILLVYLNLRISTTKYLLLSEPVMS